jgi:hypothetical protein
MATMASHELLATWRGPTWQAMVSREPYGLHFSVSGRRRTPTDEEVDQARDAYAGILPSAEITEWWRQRGQVNPWVRHFASDGHPAARA